MTRPFVIVLAPLADISFFEVGPQTAILRRFACKRSLSFSWQLKGQSVKIYQRNRTEECWNVAQLGLTITTAPLLFQSKSCMITLCAFFPLLSLIKAYKIDPEVIRPNCCVVRRVGLLSVVQDYVHLFVGPLVCTVPE